MPTITSATYDASTGALVVTGTGFLKLNGATNDIDANKFTITGEGGSTYTLTTANVEITTGTAFTVTLNATDRGVNQSQQERHQLHRRDDLQPGCRRRLGRRRRRGRRRGRPTGNGITVSNVAVPTHHVAPPTMPPPARSSSPAPAS